MVDRETEKVASTRWFQVVMALRALIPIWSMKLVITIYICIQLGLDVVAKIQALVHINLEKRAADQYIENKHYRARQGRSPKSESFVQKHVGFRDGSYEQQLFLEAGRHYHRGRLPGGEISFQTEHCEPQR